MAIEKVRVKRESEGRRKNVGCEVGRAGKLFLWHTYEFKVVERAYSSGLLFGKQEKGSWIFQQQTKCISEN